MYFNIVLLYDFLTQFILTNNVEKSGIVNNFRGVLKVFFSF